MAVSRDEYFLLVCRDMTDVDTEAAAPWVADLGDRKQAELRFATDSERTRVAVEALNLGYRVQFTTLDEFADESGLAQIKGCCSSYYADDGSTNPTSAMEYQTGVAGELISVLEEMYQFEAWKL